MKVKIILISLFLFFSFLSFAQKQETINIVINKTPATVQVTEPKKQRKVRNDLRYYWYQEKHIVNTQGGYEGKLLHGYYIEFYANGQLKIKGQFRFGVQQGEWKYWDAEGNLQRVEHWRNNQLNGKTYLYEKGEISKIIWYKSGENVKENKIALLVGGDNQ